MANIPSLRSPHDDSALNIHNAVIDKVNGFDYLKEELEGINDETILLLNAVRDSKITTITPTLELGTLSNSGTKIDSNSRARTVDRIPLKRGDRIITEELPNHDYRIIGYDINTGEHLGGLIDGWLDYGVDYTAKTDVEVMILSRILDDGYSEVLDEQDVINFENNLTILKISDSNYARGLNFVPGIFGNDGTKTEYTQWSRAFLEEEIVLSRGFEIGFHDYSKYSLNVARYNYETGAYVGSYGRGSSSSVTTELAKYNILPSKKNQENLTDEELLELRDLVYIEKVSNSGGGSVASGKYNIVDDIEHDIELIHVDNFGETDDETTGVQDAEIHGLYDDLMSGNGAYISRDDFGLSSGGRSSYLYKFRPHTLDIRDGTTPRPKIMIVAGVHGNEKSSVYTTYTMMKLISNHWKENKLLEFLRFNVDFDIVPILNPDGFNAHTRSNGNGIDLNRDFPASWFSTDGWEGNGDAPLSQPESTSLHDYLNNNSDYDLVIDFHNMTPNDNGITYTISDFEDVREWTSRMLITVGRRWQKEFPEYPQDDVYPFGYVRTPTGGTTTKFGNSIGLNMMTLEIGKVTPWRPSGMPNIHYNQRVLDAGLILLAETLKGSIKMM